MTEFSILPELVVFKVSLCVMKMYGMIIVVLIGNADEAEHVFRNKTRIMILSHTLHLKTKECGLLCALT